MPFLRPNQPLSVLIEPDLQNFTLQEPLPFNWRGRLLRVRAGGTSDGLSAPKFTKAIFEDTNTGYPAVAHDGGYRDQLEESSDQGESWQPVTLTKEECDAMLYELCIENGVNPKIAKLIYEAVHLFGQLAWNSSQAIHTPAQSVSANALNGHGDNGAKG